MNFRIGEGWDVHALVPGRRLVIGGVEIAHSMGLHPRLVPGGAQNFKVTYPDDFALAAAVLAQRAHGATLDRFGGARGQAAAFGKKTIF